MCKHFLLVFFLIPAVFIAQEYTRVDVYQYKGKDSMHTTLARRCIFLPNGKLSIDSCFNFMISSEAQHDGVTVYEYNDTFLVKRRWGSWQLDSIAVEYRYNAQHQCQWKMAMKKGKRYPGHSEPTWLPLSTTESKYDSAGRIVATHFQASGTQFSGNTWTYDDSGRVLVQCGYNISTLISRDEHIYNGRKHTIVHRLYNTDGTGRTEDSTVFGYGPLRTTIITTDSAGNEIEILVTAEGKQCERTISEYDAYGRIVRRRFYKDTDAAKVTQYYKYFP